MYWHSYAVGARNKFACNTSKQCIKGNDMTITIYIWRKLYQVDLSSPQSRSNSVIYGKHIQILEQFKYYYVERDVQYNYYKYCCSIL